MKVDELASFGIPEKYIDKLKEEKISELYQPQEDVIRKGLFKERNLILSLPTASGKTLIATMSMLHTLLQSKQHKIVYLAPLVSLAREKYNYFKKFFGKDFKVAISIGDLDSSDPWLAEHDVICLTNEKLDSLLRHNVEWVKRIGLIIVDEIHMLNDSSRGPTLEILLTKLMKIVPKSQILGLSATISNADELARWINASLVISDFRPVKLYEGVSFNSKIHFDEKDGYELNESEDVENAIIQNTLELNKQALIFTATRKNAESLAERLCKTVKFKLKGDEQTILDSLCREVEGVLEYPTQQCKKLAGCIRSGVAFHHAGLLGKQKSLIEESFRIGKIKTIVATPTLAMGVNLPAFRVLIRDAKRYYQGIGSRYIPVLEYKQFVGRAGRPKYDAYGESILLAKSEGEAKDLIQRFIFGQPEDITSKLALEPVLRMHTLALIASEFCNSEESLFEFFDRTFYALHYGDIDAIREKLYEILQQHLKWGLITKTKSGLNATRIGKRVSELYIDPLTAHEFLNSLGISKKRMVTEFSFLQLISNSLEMRPLLSVRVSEMEDIQKKILESHRQILQDIPEEYDLEFENFVDSIKTTLMFENWINEASEDLILTKFKMAPGELHNKLLLVDWLIYTLHELALLSGYKEILTAIRKLRVRSKYGIKEELTPLVRLKGIGRVRARRLFNAGLNTLDKLRKIPIGKLSDVIGTKIAKEKKKQLVENVREEKQSTLNSTDGVAGI
ncbi:MAG: DEAD/DEAH box helicase [Candidatus Aenigmarchaeota archaeon]|nr:DEAD/DEAH box helicase [Candidatus Aenigmarchaeota archaeon]